MTEPVRWGVAATGGIAAYCNAQDLGNLVLDSFVNGRRVRRAL